MKNLFKILLPLLVISASMHALDEIQPLTNKSASQSTTATEDESATISASKDASPVQEQEQMINLFPEPATQNSSKVLESFVLVDDEKTKSSADLVEITSSDPMLKVAAPYEIEIECLDKAAAAQYEKNMADPKLVAASRGWCGGPGPVGWDGQSGQHFTIQARDNDRAVAETMLGGHYGTCPQFVTYVFNKTTNTLTNAADGAVIDNPQAVQAFAHFWDAIPMMGNIEEILQAEATEHAELKKLTPPQLRAHRKQHARHARHAALLEHAKARLIKHHGSAKHAAKIAKKHKAKKPEAKHTDKKHHKTKHHGKKKHLKAPASEAEAQQITVLKGSNGAGIYHGPAMGLQQLQELPALQPATTEAAPQPVVTQDTSITSAATGN